MELCESYPMLANESAKASHDDLNNLIRTAMRLKKHLNKAHGSCETNDENLDHLLESFGKHKSLPVENTVHFSIKGSHLLSFQSSMKFICNQFLCKYEIPKAASSKSDGLLLGPNVSGDAMSSTEDCESVMKESVSNGPFDPLEALSNLLADAVSMDHQLDRDLPLVENSLLTFPPIKSNYKPWDCNDYS